jgi:hypothetical protein
MRIAAIGVSNEIGDSSVDRQSYVAFVIEVVATLGLSIGPNITWNESHSRAPMSRSPRESCGSCRGCPHIIPECSTALVTVTMWYLV